MLRFNVLERDMSVDDGDRAFASATNRVWTSFFVTFASSLPVFRRTLKAQ